MPISPLDAVPAPEARESGRTTALAALELLPGPVAATAAAVALTIGDGTVVESGFVCFLAMLVGAAIGSRRAGLSALLPMMSVVGRLGGPLLGLCLLALAEIFISLPGLGPQGLAVASAACAVAAMAAELVVRRLEHPSRRVRLAVIGPADAADSLAREIKGAGNRDYAVIGRIEWRSVEDRDGEVPTLGTLEDLGGLVERHQIDRVLMTGQVPRLAVFDEISRSCLHLPVRLQELAGFYEDTFGHVPVGEINAAWFQYIMHPRYRHSSPLAQRALDIVVSAAAIVALAPLLVVLGLLIRRDGGPALFRQVRIGEGGRPFTIWKLRTMQDHVSAEWAEPGDPRVTRLGRLLRRSHLDELPQLFNILVGDMSLVGPRPEQPEFVERLERSVPFYSRRHLVKPGLTGWAQVRCGYAGSDIGSAWKVSHDLFYLKHRSFWLNLMILGETLRTLVADRQYTAEPHTVAFILRPESLDHLGVQAMPETPEWAAAAVEA